jgi:anaerobic C4-dicarboxylate transporter
VLAGALIGQHWGLPGVASGVLAAQIVTYALVTQLSLRLTSLSVTAWTGAHVRGLILGIVVGLGLWLLVAVFRSLGAPPALTLGTGLLVCAVVAIAIIRLRLIGPDGLWLLQSLAGRLPRRLGALPRLLGLGDSAAAGVRA